MKKYNLIWLADDGERVNLGSVITANPKEALFNTICSMIVRASSYFRCDTDVNLKKLIRSGNTQREHYFAEIGQQHVSIIEQNQ